MQVFNNNLKNLSPNKGYSDYNFKSSFINRDKSETGNFKIRIRRNSSCNKFEFPMDDPITSKINTYFNFPKDPVKMKMKKYYPKNKQLQTYEFKTIFNHHNVFVKESNNLYTNEYMNKIFKLLNKHDKNYFNKKKMLVNGGENEHRKDIYITEGVMSSDHESESNILTFHQPNLKLYFPESEKNKEIVKNEKKFELKDNSELDFSSDSFLNKSKEKIIRENVFKKLRTEYKFFTKDKLSYFNFNKKDKSLKTHSEILRSDDSFIPKIASNLFTLELSTDAKNIKYNHKTNKKFLPSFIKPDVSKQNPPKNISFGRILKPEIKIKEKATVKKLKNTEHLGRIQYKSPALVKDLLKDLKYLLNEEGDNAVVSQ